MSSSLMAAFPIGASATIEELEGDQYTLLARLRAEEPVSWLPALSGWLITNRELALWVMRDFATFTVDDPRFSTAQVIGPSMLSLDGAVHAHHREPFARSFRPAQTRARFTTFVADEVDRLIARLRRASRAEIRGDLAGPLAVSVVTKILGIEGADAATVRSWYDAFVSAISDITAGRGDGTAAAEAYATLRASVEKVLATGQKSSLLIDAAAQEEGLTAKEVVANAAVLMFGGIDTTEGMITNAALHLLSHPDQLALVLDDRDLLANAIEESVRLEPAAAVVDRYATREVRLGGAQIAEGDLVRVSITAANRDPVVFSDPDRFDVRRENARLHLGFAYGPHFCFGAHLARLEAHATLSRLLDLPGLHLDPARPTGPRGLVFRKPRSLHVAWESLADRNL